MALADWVSKIVAYFRAGYPSGMPLTGYVPIVALSRRRLADAEIVSVTEQLIAQGCWVIGNADVGVAISRLTQEMPALDDIERVHDRLDTLGCTRGRRC
ncbi:DUF3349 domain-containing protein [Mycobacterium szulgai]|uniref:DUF3349 domain-containing protein n=1 Tax=Mycobacterium szulgai TaxID=1787 RepID=A0A1X2DLQ0_MYCSZ|nr:DUF3349 domain-containing protein [Mycobacterium szulgai]MCV7077580.1 DUF3349 domain-containing protein [Mycobacterium szulgai]ORW89063.1 hypothetical protein AWC27_13355 [Mycobacterium szulgai]